MQRSENRQSINSTTWPARIHRATDISCRPSRLLATCRGTLVVSPWCLYRKHEGNTALSR